MKIMLLTPPFTQLNAPYPATMFLKGFLHSQHYHDVVQIDLGISLIHSIFTNNTLNQIFDVAQQKKTLSRNATQILSQREKYCCVLPSVIQFLRGNDPTLAHRLSKKEFYPHASRFQENLSKLEEDIILASSPVHIVDLAKFWATRYIEDIGDFITEAITPYFGFVRYAEKLGLSAHSFEPIEQALQSPPNLIDNLLHEILQQALQEQHPNIVGITIPFPGNLYSALRCGQTIRQQLPDTTIVLGGGYVNTELRNLKELKIFDYTHYITLDDGELPLLAILEHLQGKRTQHELIRTYLRQNNTVVLIHKDSDENIPFSQRGTPNYEGIRVQDYLSFIDIANPLQRLWTDGFWNKLALAHGCYWHRCAFCDTHLPYVCHFQPNQASSIVDQMQAILQTTQQTGFHFVDEATPPALLKEVSSEILRRKMVVTWWTNIRFEKSFTPDVCKLMQQAGCIAVTGGIETPCDRLLEKISKGMTLAQLIQVLDHFKQAEIMVHGYLMYGIPTQTIQEIINGLEIVRQLFENELLHSAYWHHFALTAHSPIFQNPEQYNITILPSEHTFAYNDVTYQDNQKIDYSIFSQGLRNATNHFLVGVTNIPLEEFFLFPIPKAKINKQFIREKLKK